MYSVTEYQIGQLRNRYPKDEVVLEIQRQPHSIKELESEVSRIVDGYRELFISISSRLVDYEKFISEGKTVLASLTMHNIRELVEKGKL